jgi:tRNA modification GTPase
MPLDLDDTIVALASPPGSALRGIVRVSGLATADIVATLFCPDETSNSWRSSKLPRRFTGHLELSSIIVPVPAALMFWPTKRSYTGQPMAEFHLIGSPPLLEATIEHLCEKGARLARRGEFTMRAFLSGRIDLLQAEAVLGVIEATDHEELQKALSQLGGRMTSRLGQVRGDLIALLGDLEAGLDFVEEDIEFITKPEIARRLDEALLIVRQLAEDSASRLPAGYRRRVVLAGLPNAGKSTLFNRLIGQQKAIVSPIAGTTRDYLTATLPLDSMEVELIDTAGWEDAADLIMARAQELRGEQVSASDLVVWCTAADLSDLDQAEDEQLRRLAAKQSSAMIHVMTRVDLMMGGPDKSNATTLLDKSNATALLDESNATALSDESNATIRSVLSVSAETGHNIEALREMILACLNSANASRSELLGTTAVRCRDSLQRATQSLDHALTTTRANHGDELISMEIRSALHELGTILGDVYTDDILDHIFSNFCIGK